ncbi:hypothetical protein [Bradyrhizobium sp. HKCCYLRH1062]|uniref:hypothetical protein n=1 Tax=unclassified Bradyrhizobium TaxID=2631580 RepID=UPI003EBD903A
MHAIVLVQGLRQGKLPEALSKLVERHYRHFLGGTHGTVDICRLKVDPSIAPSVAFELSSALMPAGYYARINDETRMFVSFPTSVSYVLRSDPQTAIVARKVGQLYGVKGEHMRFEEMFELDHPEMHDLIGGGGSAGSDDD